MEALCCVVVLSVQHVLTVFLSIIQGYKLTKKRDILSLSTAFTFIKLNMCKYLYEHHKIQQLRHKLNKFHRHVTNRN